MSLATDGIPLLIRDADIGDLAAIADIFNQGVADRIATLDEDPKSEAAIEAWFAAHADRYGVLVAERAGRIVGWASLNLYSHRCAYRGVADLSIYIERMTRGAGVGSVLLAALERRAKTVDFHKLVLFALPCNDAGLRLYGKFGFRTVGTFREQGRLDGRFVDVIAMEKILKPFVLFVCRHNTGRSQMAEAFVRRFAGDGIEVASAGTIAADRPDPGVVTAMAEVGIDISSARPKVADPALAARADRIVTMGCDVQGIPRVDDDWGLPDPKGQPLARICEIRDMIAIKAENLANQLLRVP